MRNNKLTFFTLCLCLSLCAGLLMGQLGFAGKDGKALPLDQSVQLSQSQAQTQKPVEKVPCIRHLENFMSYFSRGMHPMPDSFSPDGEFGFSAYLTCVRDQAKMEKANSPCVNESKDQSANQKD